MNFLFFMPTRVYEEENCIKNHSVLLSQYGKNAMIITGKSSAKKNGSYKDICEVLDSMNINHILFDDIEENPSIETIMKARNVGVAEGVDFCIGIGGGSPMDAAKAIALMIYHKDSDETYLYDEKATSEHLPVICIPTTCGTGSEVTGVSVLTIHEKKTKGSIKHQIFPELALIDGRYLKYAPISIIRNTAVDALCHLCESNINTKSTPYSRMCSDAGLKAWKEIKNLLLEDSLESANYSELASLMRASAFAGISIAQTATSIPHGLSYPVTYNLNIPHGMACGYFLSAFIEEAPEDLKNHILSLTGFESSKDMHEFIKNILNFMPISDEILQLAKKELCSNKAKLQSAPFIIDESVIDSMYENIKSWS